MVITSTSLKGGCGKTTVTINLAVLLAHAGLKTAIIDADTNQSCIEWSANRPPNLPPIPVFGLPDGNALVPNVRQLQGNYDVVLIDGTPSLNKTTSRIIMVADLVIIPICPSQLDTWASQKFVQHYWAAVEQKGSSIPASFIINRYKKTTIATEMEAALEGAKGISTYESVIKDRVSYLKSISEGKGVFEMKDEKGKQEMIRFFNETNEMLTKISNSKLS